MPTRQGTDTPRGESVTGSGHAAVTLIHTRADGQGAASAHATPVPTVPTETTETATEIAGVLAELAAAIEALPTVRPAVGDARVPLVWKASVLALLDSRVRVRR